MKSSKAYTEAHLYGYTFHLYPKIDVVELNARPQKVPGVITFYSYEDTCTLTAALQKVLWIGSFTDLPAVKKIKQLDRALSTRTYSPFAEIFLLDRRESDGWLFYDLIDKPFNARVKVIAGASYTEKELWTIGPLILDEDNYAEVQLGPYEAILQATALAFLRQVDEVLPARLKAMLEGYVGNVTNVH